MGTKLRPGQYDCAADALAAIEDAGRRVAALSVREREVLHLLTDGMQNKHVAHALGISARTVEIHRASMMQKLGVRTFAGAIRIAIMAALATDPVPEPTTNEETADVHH